MELIVPALFIVIALIVGLFLLQLAGKILTSIVESLDGGAVGAGFLLLIAVIAVAVILFVLKNNS